MGHGSAVAHGMLLEAELGEAVGVTEPGTRAELEAALAPFGLGGALELDADADEVLGYLGADKKARAGRPRFVLLEESGRASPAHGWSREVDPAAVREVVERALPFL
jgi:3-dehydroquinate synthase